jgi:hypothetical protein
MTTTMNPFVSAGAKELDEEQIIDYYIDDHNYSRIISSKQNIFLVGERGSGKSMTLLYNALHIQQLKARRAGKETSLEYVGVYIPCNTPLFHKADHELLDDFRAGIVSEHFLAVSIVFRIADTLSRIPDLLADVDEESIRAELEYVADVSLLPKIGLFDAIKRAMNREQVLAQRLLNSTTEDLFYERSMSFATLVIPVLEVFRQLPLLKGSHFLLMLDDAHDLNPHQVRALNSWIAYRDRSWFSFKVATAKVGQPAKITASGGTILEGHDYFTIDMEEPIHNEESDFGRLAEKIVTRRLELAGISRTPEQFFPIDASLRDDLAAAEKRVRAKAATLFTDTDSREFTDYVYKQSRPEYFRSRPKRANLPTYSGFSTLVYISTGVIRNLLEPCGWMYDAAISRLPPDQRTPSALTEIPPGIQAEVLRERSTRAWDQLKRLDTFVKDCTQDDASRVYQMFDQLAIYFKERLMKHRSEPGAISFSISQQRHSAMKELEPLLAIAQRASFLYVREGPSKTGGRRESYYVPNRILWPIRGLDPHGQHARASIKSTVLLQAANGVAIPLHGIEDISVDGPKQRELFDA